MDANRSVKVILSLDPIKFPLTGIGRYTFELAKHFVTSNRLDDIRFLVGHRFVDAIPVPHVGATTTLHVKRQLLKSRLAVSVFQSTSSVLRRRALRGLDDFVFHGPNFYLPDFNGKSVATFHDLSMFRWGHCHPPERVRYMEKEIGLSLKRATFLITDSEYTRREVAEFFAWPIERIRSVPLAASAEFYPRDRSCTSKLLQQLGLSPGGYTLFSGTIEPRKNIATLLSAYESLPVEARRRWPLVLCGYAGWNSEDLHERIERATRQGWAKYFGYLPSADLPLLFAGARLFVFPSLYEGFGLPVLEAMASGVPVVCSNAASLPEVAGDAAATCDPRDTQALQHLIERGLLDEQWRETAVMAGLARAAKFSWQSCAAQTISVYEELQHGSICAP